MLVSARSGDKLGTRRETKNLNSFRNVEKAVEYEVKRQIEVLEKGESVVQETRGWDDAKQRTFSQRSKEEAQDYRYMPDPDLPPVILDDAQIDAVRSEMPVMPDTWRTRLSGLGLDKSQTTTLLEADVEAIEVSYLGLIEEVITDQALAKALANWFVNFEIPLRRDESVKISTELTNQGRLQYYQAVFILQKDGKLSSSNAKALLTKLFSGPAAIRDVTAFAKEHNLIQESDEGAMQKLSLK